MQEAINKPFVVPIRPTSTQGMSLLEIMFAAGIVAMTLEVVS